MKKVKPTESHDQASLIFIYECVRGKAPIPSSDSTRTKENIAKPCVFIRGFPYITCVALFC